MATYAFQILTPDVRECPDRLGKFYDEGITLVHDGNDRAFGAGCNRVAVVCHYIDQHAHVIEFPEGGPGLILSQQVQDFD